MSRRSTPCVALLTDFGTRDWYVGTIKGVLLSRCPQIPLIDLTHEIPPQDILAGAFTLSATVRWFPSGTVFVCVVDPGVGSRRALLAASANGYFFVGPDNGVLALALEGKAQRTIVRLTNPRYWLKTISRTFQGRDILAPVAAHLACGGSLRALGVTVTRIHPLTVPPLQRSAHKLIGCILHIDTFGNLITNIPQSAMPSPNRMVKRTVRYKHQWARMVSSYAAGRPNELLAIIGSLGLLELAIREGSAARTLNATRGDRVEVAF